MAGERFASTCSDWKYKSKRKYANQPLPTLFSTLKLPDICIYNRENARPILQIEVDSGGLKKTIRKLAFGLIDQLRHERNQNDSITTCTGFYFPRNSTYTSVIEVTLAWSDITIDFRTTHNVVRKGNVIREIVQAIKIETMKNTNMQESTRREFFTIPLT